MATGDTAALKTDRWNLRRTAYHSSVETSKEHQTIDTAETGVMVSIKRSDSLIKSVARQPLIGWLATLGSTVKPTKITPEECFAGCNKSSDKKGWHLKASTLRSMTKTRIQDKAEVSTCRQSSEAHPESEPGVEEIVPPFESLAIPEDVKEHTYIQTLRKLRSRDQRTLHQLVTLNKMLAKLQEGKESDKAEQQLVEYKRKVLEIEMEERDLAAHMNMHMLHLWTPATPPILATPSEQTVPTPHAPGVNTRTPRSPRQSIMPRPCTYPPISALQRPLPRPLGKNAHMYINGRSGSQHSASPCMPRPKRRPYSETATITTLNHSQETLVQTPLSELVRPRQSRCSSTPSESSFCSNSSSSSSSSLPSLDSNTYASHNGSHDTMGSRYPFQYPPLWQLPIIQVSPAAAANLDYADFMRSMAENERKAISNEEQDEADEDVPLAILRDRQTQIIVV